MLITKSRKRNCERDRTTKLGNQENAEIEGHLKVLRNIGICGHQTSRDERNNKKQLGVRITLLEGKFCCRNLIKGKKTDNWVVPLWRYSATFKKETGQGFKWTKGKWIWWLCTRLYIAYQPLTEQSCSSSVNRRVAICRCKQIAWVDSRKCIRVAKGYMHTPTTVTVNLAACSQKSLG